MNEVSALLSVHPKTLYKWTRTRRIPHVRIGGRLRFSERELGRWIAAQAEIVVSH